MASSFSSPDGCKAGWLSLVLEVPGELADELVARLAGPSLGVWSSDTDVQPVRLRVYFDSREAADEARRIAVEVIERHGIDPGSVELAIEAIADGRWVERYQASLKPFPFAGRFVVWPCPDDGRPRQGAGRDARIPIRLVPGRAFGTGEHPTSELSAKMLERFVRPGDSWIDLGCGSGILSCVAAHCGARRVLALDLDPGAVAVAREVVRRNELADRIEVRQGSAGDSSMAADGLVANILASFFLTEAESLVPRVRPGGFLVVSGVLSRERHLVREALQSAGFEPVQLEECREWCAEAYRRATAGSG